MEYSKTVNLPITDFPMKANLPVRELDIQKFWEENEIYQKLVKKDSPKGDFILHDGPPYSNGDIHIGHALNKLLKDFVVRYMGMQGYRMNYYPGWDNHGMPIENKVSEEFRKKKIVPTKIEMRKACRAYAQKWVDIQRDQFKRLGNFAHWDKPYLTMSTGYESAIIKVFGELVEKGFIYRGLKPIHWCIHDETALAEAEIEYATHKSNSIYVRFPLADDPNGYFNEFDKSHCYTIIWTTTPWTIPANLAVAIHPDEDYAYVQYGEDIYLLAEELVSHTMTAIGAENYCVLKTIKGSKIEGLAFKHPLYERNSPVVFADYVTMEDGTGVVHTAPGHGRDDFYTGQRNNLPVLNPVNEKGYYTKDAGQFEGLHIIRQGNQAVLDALKESTHLLASGVISHSYPHCWRCHNPLIFRTTVQWFMALDHNELRHKILNSLGKIEYFPEEAKNRLSAMMENSPDWCLSRQRSWGVGIPVFFCKSCSEPIMTKESINAVYEDSKVNGSDSWFEKDAADLLPAGFVCPKCGAAEFSKETDVLDVWFDSGSSCRAVLEQFEGLHYPADLYCEGSDQHRGWFNKSMVVGTATKGVPPFKHLMSHGFVLDSEGKAMSKSLGNTIAPQKIIQQYGADILRLFISSCDYSEDVRIGDEMIKRVTDSYRRIRNTFRFILGNISDFDPENNCIEYSEMEEIDKYAMHKLEDLVNQVTINYNDFEFHKVYRAIHNYCAVDLSSFYMDILKDRLYASKADWKVRRSAQSVLYQILVALTKLLAPIISHTCEEVWQHIPGKREESVFLSKFPTVRHKYTDSEIVITWDAINEVREKVLLALETSRQAGLIGKPIESKAIIGLPLALYLKVHPYTSILPSVFIVSQVEIKEIDGETVEVSIVKPEGEKCERCWLYVSTVGSSSEHPKLCDRCAKAVSE